MSTLSTHVLDTMHGRPAKDIPIRLSCDGALLFEGVTDQDGRCAKLREAVRLAAGGYVLEFEVAAYFRAAGAALPDPPFFDRITIAFAVIDGGAHYHVPLLVSPFGYSTYRGS